MRITFVMPFLALEGGSRVVAVYAEALSRRGHEVTVLSCANRPWPLGRLARHYAKRLLRGRLGPERVPTHFDDLPHLHVRVRGRGPIRPRHAPDADVIVATWWETAEWVAAMPAAKGRKVHLIQHDEREFYQDPAMKARVAATWRLPGFHRVVIAGWLGELGRREFGVESDLVNNAVDMTVFDAPPRQRNAVPTVGLMYHSRPFKGTDVSLRAYDLARAQLPDLRLKAFGPHDPVPGLPLPAGVALEVQPPQSAIAAFYRACDAYLFGSRSEGFGLPILEAMACRTPVIGTPTGAAPELIAEGGGRLVPMEDPAAMARAIVELATMPAPQWRAMSDAAYDTARRRSWAAAAEAFEGVLLRIAGLPRDAALTAAPAAGYQTQTRRDSGRLEPI